MHIILCSDSTEMRGRVGGLVGPEDRLTVCESGMELLAAVQAVASDLVILDLETHGLGGMLLISAIQELSPGSPIVAVSQDGAADARQMLQKGIPFFRLAAGDAEAPQSLRAHMLGRQTRSHFAGASSVSAA
ncbi:MAG TPA: response regulator [Candidatus Baltobacteraceae bacterium]|nr:response regulator [Candidatus Baltobacteraceae bacterium]